jgi:diguanylate cyclase (GGDEF)-like protein
MENSKDMTNVFATFLSQTNGLVIFKVSTEGDFLANRFEYVSGDADSLEVSRGSLSFGYLLSARNNFLGLTCYQDKKGFLKTIAPLQKKDGFMPMEFCLSDRKSRHLYTAGLISRNADHLFYVGIRRLDVLEGYLNEFVERSQHDYTTGLLNKECCLAAIREITSEDSAVVLFMDLNNFKLVNDVYGHIQGDSILQHFGSALMDNKLPNSHFYRYGGDEFVAIFHNASFDQVAHFLEGVKTSFEEEDTQSIPVSFSAGGVAMSPKIKEPLYLIRCSDKAMYIAKKKDVPYYFLSEKDALEIIEEESNK